MFFYNTFDIYKFDIGQLILYLFKNLFFILNVIKSPYYYFKIMTGNEFTEWKYWNDKSWDDGNDFSRIISSY